MAHPKRKTSKLEETKEELIIKLLLLKLQLALSLVKHIYTTELIGMKVKCITEVK